MAAFMQLSLIFIGKLYLSLRFTKNRWLTAYWSAVAILAPSSVIQHLYRWPRFQHILVMREHMQIHGLTCFGNVAQNASELTLQRLNCYLSCLDWELRHLTEMCGLLFGDEYTRRFVVQLWDPRISAVAHILHVTLMPIDGVGKGPRYQLLRPGEDLSDWQEPVFGRVCRVEPPVTVDTSAIDALEDLLGPD